MKKVLVFIIVLFIIGMHGVLGQDIDFNYPNSVNINEEFDVTISLVNFEEDSYDIKFEILNGSSNIAERYWEDEWRSTNYWMDDAINLTENDESDFELRIKENYGGENNFLVKVRNSEGDIEEFPYGINIVPQTSNDIYYELEWDEDDIANNREFKIEFHAFNLDDEKYDVKMWIEDEDENIISDRYDFENEVWKSGRYYIDEFIEGPGDVSDKFKLRIDEKYEDFIGEAKVFFKIRDLNKIEEDIDIIQKESIVEEELIENKIEKVEKVVDKPSITGQVIKLGTVAESDIDTEESEDIKSGDNKFYESSNVKMVEYSIYGFTLLCVIMCTLIMWRKLE